MMLVYFFDYKFFVIFMKFFSFREVLIFVFLCYCVFYNGVCVFVTMDIMVLFLEYSIWRIEFCDFWVWGKYY